jgi:uncharacterized protein (TIGR02594 family)
MVEFHAFRRSFHVATLALCSVAFAASASPASATAHRHGAQLRHERHNASRHVHPSHLRSVGVSQARRAGSAARTNFVAGEGSAGTAGSGGFSYSSLVAEARRYIGGGNPTGRSNLWSARFMNMVLQRTGHTGTGSDMASSFARYGHRVSGPQVGAIAVMARRGGGHVGIITGVDSAGNPIMISGNNGNRVRELPISRNAVYAYVMPTS